jgi:magnesium transporter
MDFIVGKDFLITTHYDLIDPLHKFSKLFDTQALLNNHQQSEHAGMIMISMIKKLYKAVEHEVESVRQNLHDIEEHIFSSHHVEMVSAISRSSRDLLNLRHTIEPHRDALQSFELFATQLFDPAFAIPLKTLTNEYYRVHNHIIRETESLHELRETNNSMLTTKQNETMRIFTILAFVTFPLTLIVDVFNIDSKYNPLLGHPYDFWFVLGILAFVTLCMFGFFKMKKWL